MNDEIYPLGAKDEEEPRFRVLLKKVLVMYVSSSNMQNLTGYVKHFPLQQKHD